MHQPLSLENIFSLIVKHSNQLVVLTDTEGNVLYSNDLFEKITGYSLVDGDRLSDIPFIDFMHQEDIASIKLLYQTNLLEKKKDFSYNVQIKSVENENVWYRISSKAIKVNQKDYYFLHSVEDISMQKSTEQKLNKDKAKAVENDRLKSAFLANMSHEIRTPMNTIVGFTKLLAESNDPEEKEQFAEIVKSSGAHLLNLINDIIDISKIEAGFHDIQLKAANINDLLGDVRDLYLHDNRLVSKQLSLELKSGLSYLEASVLTDETRFRQIVSNLIDNAIKFTNKGGVKFGYSLNDETYNDGTHKLLFYVKDQGIGIPKEEQKRIFERFHQVDGEGKKLGTGLGLSIVKTLVKKLGGDIWVDSKEGEGSTFFFTMPYLQKKAELKDKGIEKTSAEIPNFQGKTILIAEDIATNYQYLEALLRKTKAEIIWAKNGNDALQEVLSQKKIDLVLMDLRMPVMNGYDATKQIKLIKPKLPVLAVTAYAYDGDMEKAFEFGCDDYITKPVMRGELFSKMELFMT